MAMSNGQNPWACRSCGCINWKVKDSRFNGAEPKKRERMCRNCGEPMTTYEVPVPEGFKLAIVPVGDEAEGAVA